MEVQKKQPFGNFMPKRTDIQKILIIGSGPIVIGQACEFDYSGTQACKALREEGYQVVLVNSNPATIMTDPEFADVTYIEPLTVEVLEKIILKEKKLAKVNIKIASIEKKVAGKKAKKLAKKIWNDEDFYLSCVDKTKKLYKKHYTEYEFNKKWKDGK